MRVDEVMERDVALIPYDDTVQVAAQAMADTDSDAILIGAGDRLDGVLTARDVLIRVVARGLDPAMTPVKEVMSSTPWTCGDADEVESIAERMDEHDVDRMPVLDANGRLVGLITRSAARRAAVRAA